MDTIGQRLDRIRKLKNMSMEEFGIFLGYGKGKTAPRQIISRMINDYRKPSLENYQKLNNEGVDLNWLINGIGNLYSPNDQHKQEDIYKYNFYNGQHYVESVVASQASFPEIINMQGNEIFTVKINTEMMAPTIKIGDSVNAVKVEKIIHNGLYIGINEIDGEKIFWIKRLFLSSSGELFKTVCDNPNYPDEEISKQNIEKNELILRVYSLLLTIDKI